MIGTLSEPNSGSHRLVCMYVRTLCPDVLERTASYLSMKLIGNFAHFFAGLQALCMCFAHSYLHFVTFKADFDRCTGKSTVHVKFAAFDCASSSF